MDVEQLRKMSVDPPAECYISSTFFGSIIDTADNAAIAKVVPFEALPYPQWREHAPYLDVVGWDANPSLLREPSTRLADRQLA